MTGECTVHDETRSSVETKPRVAHGGGRLEGPTVAGVVVGDVHTHERGGGAADDERCRDVGSQDVLAALGATRRHVFIQARVDVYDGDVHAQCCRYLDTTTHQSINQAINQ